MHVAAASSELDLSVLVCCAACPTCGQYLTMVERVFTLRQEVVVLEQRVATLEATGVVCTVPSDSTNTSSNGGNGRQKNSCVVDDEADIRTFEDDTFTTLSDGSICYCNVS